jgi:DNA-binding LacI/PurR family transcriptional regulator
MILSSEKLVEHDSPSHPPVFASHAVQSVELQRLADSLPRLCAGILLDHLWEESLLATTRLPAVPRLLLARPSRVAELDSVSPDFANGAHQLLAHLRDQGSQHIYLGVPFNGDPAVDATGEALRAAAAAKGWPTVEALDCSTPAARAETIAKLRASNAPVGLICTEDNVTALLIEELAKGGDGAWGGVALAGMQGTGEIECPIIRLRYDYRQLGREAVRSAIEHRQGSRLISPAELIIPLPDVGTYI